MKLTACRLFPTKCNRGLESSAQHQIATAVWRQPPTCFGKLRAWGLFPTRCNRGLESSAQHQIATVVWGQPPTCFGKLRAWGLCPTKCNRGLESSAQHQIATAVWRQPPTCFGKLRAWGLFPTRCNRGLESSLKQPRLTENNHLHVSGSLEPGACSLQNVTEGWSPASNSQGWLKTTTYRHWSLEPGAGAQPLQCTRPPSTAWCIANRSHWGTIVDRPRPRAPHYNQRSIIIVVSLLWVRKQIK